MGWYLHAVPADGGLFVPAKNLPALIEDINEIYKDETQGHLNLNPHNPQKQWKHYADTTSISTRKNQPTG